MPQNPILTAVIFTYNHGASIEKCIKSILEQKTTYPYVIHICDDASIDDTTAICRKYAAEYPEKIAYYLQPKNTFTYPYKKNHLYQEVQRLNTKYFCIIDGDDYRCNENKIQLALDFLETHPNYIGWAHDTKQIQNGEEKSYVHDIINWTPTDKVEFGVQAPFLLTSARILRNIGFNKLQITPVDYLLYYYHLSKGPIHYHDEIMSAYCIGENSCFASLSNISDLNGMFAFKLAKLFQFQKDDFCMEMQKKYDAANHVPSRRYNWLKRLHDGLHKLPCGNKIAWYVWFWRFFVHKYGLECLDINYVYPLKKIKKKADARTNVKKG